MSNAERYGVTPRTVKNWSVLAEQCGVPVPWDDPAEVLEWYREQVGREPSRKLKARVDELLADAAPEVVEHTVDVVDEGDAVTGSLAALEQACRSLGLAVTLARIVEEEERAWADYQEARERRMGVTAARRDWKEATEAKRAVHKTEDAVRVALQLLKGWARGEWEQDWKRLRILMSGVKMGAEVRDELISTTTEAEWMTVWDKALERVILDWDGEQ